MASDSELCPEETSDNECKENYYPENFSAPPLASRRLDDKDFEHHDMTRSELGFIVSASNILGCVCEESGKRSFPNQFGDLFHDPLLLCRHDQHNKMQEFLCCCQDTAKWSVEVNVVAIIFAVRFSRNHAVTHGNWERVLLVALLLAQKMVDDRPLCNQDFPEAYHIWDAFDRNGGEAWQVRSPLELRKINQLELAFLQIIEHNLYVGFSHAAFLMLEQSKTEYLQHRSQLMDVVASGNFKQTIPRSLGLIPCPINNQFKFLMVDDDLMNRLIMSQKLTMTKEFKDLEAVCDQAEHGEAALQMLKAGGQKYDVMIFDEHMENSGGKLKGTEVIRQLREEGCKSVIVSCSVSCNAQTNSGFTDAGADICWTKPFPSPLQMYHDLAQHMRSHPQF